MHALDKIEENASADEYAQQCRETAELTGYCGSGMVSGAVGSREAWAGGGSRRWGDRGDGGRHIL